MEARITYSEAAHRNPWVAPQLNAEFASKMELDRSLLRWQHSSGLFLEGHDGIAVGERVNVRVAVDGLEPVMLPAMVVWRRVAASRGNPPGIGLRFEPNATQHLHDLRRVGVAAAEDHRAHIRRPVRIPVVFLLDSDETLHPGTLADVSENGARLQTLAPPAAGRVVVMRLRSGGPTPPIAARVVWHDGGEAGLAVVADRPEARACWQALVARRRALARGGSG